MKAAEHYREAERLLVQSNETSDNEIADWQVAKAQVHATLALAAALGWPGGDVPDLPVEPF